MSKEVEEYLQRKLDYEKGVKNRKGPIGGVRAIVNPYNGRVRLTIFVICNDYMNNENVKIQTKHAVSEVKRRLKEDVGIDIKPVSAAYGKVQRFWKGRNIDLYYDLTSKDIAVLEVLAKIRM